tara:strand:+ start:287 stop:589 length:303 start_codon:yes stop_codon:yes gene_type:complete
MENNETFFDINGQECQSDDNWVARRIDFPSGYARHFAKANRTSRKLFNPNSESETELAGKTGGRETYVSVEMAPVNFESYLDFLKTKNDLMYNNANSYRR